MATIKRRMHSSRTKLGAYKIHELLTGKIRLSRCRLLRLRRRLQPTWPTSSATRCEPTGKPTGTACLEFWASGEDFMTYFYPDSKPWLFISGCLAPCRGQQNSSTARRASPAFRARLISDRRRVNGGPAAAGCRAPTSTCRRYAATAQQAAPRRPTVSARGRRFRV